CVVSWPQASKTLLEERFAGSPNALADLSGRISTLFCGRLTGSFPTNGSSFLEPSAYLSAVPASPAEQRLNQAFDEGMSSHLATGNGRCSEAVPGVLAETAICNIPVIQSVTACF
ncbi:MAG: hypothetical protein KDJ29_20390, partial [Hyphomicrobiales bacterium]|nr:hypothetical protein [Hyphomicrobiales bacterium]